MITAAALLFASVLPALAEDVPAADGALLPGIYQCFAEGQYFFLRLGGDLAYEQTEPPLDPGQYEVDASTGVLRFTTGPYAIGQWTAEVRNTADRHGVILHADQDYECKAAR
jgi:hypothetical protein